MRTMRLTAELVFGFSVVVCRCSVIIAAIMNFNTSISEPTAHLSGLKYIIDLYVLRCTVVVFDEEIDQIPWIDVLLRNISAPKIIMGKGNSSDLKGFYILFPEFGTSYVGRFSSRNHVESKFLLIWSEPAEQDDIVRVFQELWRDRRVNVVAITKQKHGNDLELHTYSSTTDSKCGSVGQPTLVNIWNWRTGEFVSHLNLFKSERLNFKGCSLTVIVNNQPPDSSVRYNNESGKWVASGVSNEILKIAEAYFNFTAIIASAELNVDMNHMWYYSSEELNYISDFVNNEKAAFAVGWFSYASIEMDNLDSRVELGGVSSIDCFGWAVPYRAGAKPPNSVYYTKEFKEHTWSLILTTFIVTCITLHYIARRNIMSSSLLVYQTLLEQPVVLDSALLRSFSFKILFANLCFYSLVITAAYRASFASFITISFPGREFKSVHDILASSLQIYGSPEMMKVLKVTSAETKSAATVLSRFRLLPPCEYEQVMKRVIRRRDIAVLGVKRSLYFHSLSEAKRIKVKIPFRFIPGCLIRPHTTHLMFRKGARLIEPFNDLLNRLFESGIISYWIAHLGSNKIFYTERFKGRTLRLHFLKEPIYFLLAGYILSTLIFGGEILYSNRLSRSQHGLRSKLQITKSVVFNTRKKL